MGSVEQATCHLSHSLYFFFKINTFNLHEKCLRIECWKICWEYEMWWKYIAAVFFGSRMPKIIEIQCRNGRNGSKKEKKKKKRWKKRPIKSHAFAFFFCSPFTQKVGYVIAHSANYI